MANKNINQLTELAVSPAVGDMIPIWDADAAATKKVSYANFLLTENFFDRNTTTISPVNAGDTLDMVTGNFAVSGAVTTALLISGATTTAVSVTGNATDALKVSTGTFTRGLNIAGTVTTGVLIGGTLTTGVSVGACTTAFTITGAVTTGYNLAGNATDGFKVTSGTVASGFNVAGGTITTGFVMGASATTGLSISGATNQAISITGNATDAIKILTGTYTNAINIAGTTTTGITIGTCSTANIAMTGTIAKGINFASATPAFGDDDDAYIAIGTWNDGITVSSQTTHFVPIQVHLDSNTSVAKDIACARFRVDTAVANTATAVGCLQLRQNLGHNVASSAILNASVNVSGAVAVQTGSLLGGYFSIEGSGAITKAGSNDCTALVAVNNNTGGGLDNVFIAMQNGTGTTVAEIASIVCEHGTATVGLNIEKTANGTAIGTGIQLVGAMTTGLSMTGATTTAISITGNASDAIKIETGTFSTGINLGGTLTTGIYIGNCTTGIHANGDAVGANARAFKGTVAVNNANFGDGYGLVEADLTLKGTVAGAVAGLSSWVNIITGTTGSNMICAQTNGIYSEATSTMTGSTVIFGMRAQCLCQSEADIAKMYPFSIVNNTNITSALIQCNAASSDLGEVTNAGTDTGRLVPLYEAGAVVGYVKIYSLA